MHILGERERKKLSAIFSSISHKLAIPKTKKYCTPKYIIFNPKEYSNVYITLLEFSSQKKVVCISTQWLNIL
jgi:hypothetical protein